MGKPPKRRVQGGRVDSKRVTAKGTRPQVEETQAARMQPRAKVSPPWVPVLMFGLLVLGALVIILNYVNLLPGDTSNWYLLLGLGLILGGIITATQYH